VYLAAVPYLQFIAIDALQSDHDNALNKSKTRRDEDVI